MKYFISVLTFSLFFLFSTVSPLSSQSLLSNVGVNFGANVPIISSQFKRTYTSPEMNIYWSYQYLNNFDLKFLFGYGKSIQYKQNKSPGKTFFKGELLGVYPSSRGLSALPFFQFGFGVENYKDQTSIFRNQGILISGCGFKISYLNEMSFVVSANLRYPFGDHYPNYFGEFSDVHLGFKTGMQYDFGLAKKKFKDIQKPTVIASSNSSEPDSSLIKHVQLYKLVSHNISLRNKILTELEELIVAQDRIIETLVLKLAHERERRESNTFVNDFERKEKLEQISEPNNKNANLQYSQVDRFYQNALSAYHSKDYQSCISILTNLKQHFSQHPLFTNFIYWIGESHFGLKNYKLAIEAFQEVQKYKGSSKLDDAMLMSGICHYRIGDYLKANKIFLDILQQFPKSEYRNKSKEYLALLAKMITS